MTPVEERSAHHWRPTACTALRSALMTRAGLRWNAYGSRARLVPPRRSNTTRCLRWDRGHDGDRMVMILTTGAVAIDGAAHLAGRDESNVSVLRLGEAAVELGGPFRRDPAPAA
ncbi:hypothetical protein ACFRCG_07015 [Embleya sp. NPDC056575]|uniref:hypothetical protein n=1 Tax=unclassified Embleya TaxID=2699296 RepID=UPI00367D4ABB